MGFLTNYDIIRERMTGGICLMDDVDVRLMLLIGMITTLIVLLIYSVVIVFKKKKYYGIIDELDYLKQELSNKTVPFELAKLRSTKKSERISKLVRQWEVRWGELEAQFVVVTENIIYTEELVSQRNFSGIYDLIENIREDLAQLDNEIDILSSEIQALKKSEERGRSNVLELKQKYEDIGLQYEKNPIKFVEIRKKISLVFGEVEAGFAKFNDYMEDCNYILADEMLALIKEKIEVLEKLIERVPMYQESIEQELRPLLTEVLNSYGSIVRSGVHLKHLEIESTVKEYQKRLENILELACNFEFSKLEEQLLEIYENAKQMLDCMKNEVELQETLKNDLQKLKKAVTFINDEGYALRERYENIKANCAMSSEDEQNFALLLNEIQIVENEKNFVLNKAETQETAMSTLYREVNYILNQVEQIKEQLVLFDKEVEGLYSGEKECRERALRLLNNFNHLKGKYQQLVFPVENEQLIDAIDRSSRALQVLFEVIGRVPINISDINEQLENTQRIIEETSHNLEREMQQAILAEGLIVYGHRYIEREGMYLVDLTIAEDQFRQGYYENVIEKMQEILNAIEGAKFNNTYNQLKKRLGY